MAGLDCDPPSPLQVTEGTGLTTQAVIIEVLIIFASPRGRAHLHCRAYEANTTAALKGHGSLQPHSTIKLQNMSSA